MLHERELLRRVQEVLAVDEQSTDPFAPRVVQGIKTPIGTLYKVAGTLALCPGSCLIANLRFTEGLNRVLSGKRVRIIILTSVIYSDFVNKAGETVTNQPFFGNSCNIALLFFDVSEAKIEKVRHILGAEYGVSTLDIICYRHSHVVPGISVRNGGEVTVGKRRKRLAD